jgi:pyrimidine oxygenase
MEVGVFIPIGNNGWLISANSPQYKPTFELNRDITLSAERYGLDFVLSMIKFRGFGGVTRHWDFNLESFTLMSGLAAATTKIRLYATCATLTMPPAMAARMASTIDDISGGRFGMNLVTGWQKAEYDQMGLWPGEAHYSDRYEYLSEYVQVMRDLWRTGTSNLKGKYFTMNNCKLSPRPSKEIDLICAGQSDEGLAFTAKHADKNFCLSKGINTPTAFAPSVARLAAANAKAGRDVGAYALVMVIADATDAAAFAKWEHYKAGADVDALAWIAAQAGMDHAASPTAHTKQITQSEGAVNFNMGTLVGSYAHVASMLDEIAAMEGVRGVLLTFDDFLEGVQKFGEHVQPLMQCRSHLMAAA